MRPARLARISPVTGFGPNRAAGGGSLRGASPKADLGLLILPKKVWPVRVHRLPSRGLLFSRLARSRQAWYCSVGSSPHASENERNPPWFCSGGAAAFFLGGVCFRW